MLHSMSNDKYRVYTMETDICPMCERLPLASSPPCAPPARLPQKHRQRQQSLGSAAAAAGGSARLENCPRELSLLATVDISLVPSRP